QAVEIADTVLTGTDLVRQRWLDNHFFGGTYSLIYKAPGGVEVTWGGAYNQYEGGHYGDIVCSRHPSTAERNYIADTGNAFHTAYRYYDGDATKKDFNTYLKASYRWDNLFVFADVQYRHVDYAIFGIDNDLRDITQDTRFDFFNPKVGITYQLSTASNVYASYALANKE